MSSYKSVSEQDSITPADQSPLEIHKGMGNGEILRSGDGHYMLAWLSVRL